MNKNSHHIAFRALQGLLVSLGSPLGWLLIRMLDGHSPINEITEHQALYAYLSVGTAIVFSLFGAYIGRSEQRLSDLALIDSLTGLYNNRFFNERLHEEYTRSIRRKENLSLALIDLDHFKQINDTHGHLIGDKILCKVSSAIKQVSREWETVARVGGEEICVIFPHSNLQEAVQAAERFRLAIKNVSAILEDGQEVGISASIGVATTSSAIATEWELYAAADKAMYKAKHGGRNQTCT